MKQAEKKYSKNVGKLCWYVAKKTDWVLVNTISRLETRYFNVLVLVSECEKAGGRYFYNIEVVKMPEAQDVGEIYIHKSWLCTTINFVTEMGQEHVPMLGSRIKFYPVDIYPNPPKIRY
jgi:hypothetical protein